MTYSPRRSCVCRSLLHVCTLALAALLSLWGPAPVRAQVSARISEIFFACSAGDTTVQYVELENIGADTVFVSSLRLEYRLADGTLGFNVSAGSLFAGQSWRRGGRLLIGSGNVQSALGSRPDITSLNFQMSRAEGTLTLYNQISGTTRIVRHATRYGTSETLMAPPDGYCLANREGAFLVAAPTPEKRDGTTFGDPGCALGSNQPDVRIAEFQLACPSGQTEAQFVELLVPSNLRLLEQIHLRGFDVEGLPLGDQPIITPGVTQVMTAGQRWLLFPIATAWFGGADHALSFTLDRAGGRLQLVRTRSGQPDTILSDIRYGALPGATLRAPAEGLSATEGASPGVFLPDTPPTPQNRALTSHFMASSECIRPGLSRFRLAEVQLRCASGSALGRFIELVQTDPLDLSDAQLEIESRGSNGELLGVQSDLFGGANGQSWAAGQRWLLATDAFRNGTLGPDALLTLPLDGAAGSLILRAPRRSDGRMMTIDSLVYGGSRLPPDGLSLVRGPDTTWSVGTSSPTPTTKAGVLLAPTEECLLGEYSPARISELKLVCRSGDPAGQFVELVQTGATDQIDHTVFLRSFDVSGVMLGESGIDDVTTVPTTWLTGRNYLLATSSWGGLQGEVPDHALTLPLATDAGAVEVWAQSRRGGAARLNQRIEYGGAWPVPGPAQSLKIDAAGNLTLSALPDPRNLREESLLETGACGLTPRPDVAIRELNLRCNSGSTEFQFVRLSPIQNFDRLEATFELTAFDRDDQPIGTIALAPSGFTRHWPVDSTLFVGSAGWGAAEGKHPDVVLPFTLDRVAGRLQITGLDRSNGLRIILQDLPYGLEGAPTPPIGGSLVRSASGSYVTRPTPTAIRWQGDALTRSPQCNAPAFSSARIDGFQLRDSLGATTAQWLSIAAPTIPQLDTTVRVEVFDRDGSRLATLQPHRPGGSFNQAGRRTFVTRCFEEHLYFPEPGPDNLYAALTSYYDARLPVSLDVEGGRFEVSAVNGATGERVVTQSLRYGPGGVPAPGPGLGMVARDTGYVAVHDPAVPSEFGFTGVFNRLARPPRIAEIHVGCPADTSAYSYISLSNAGNPLLLLDDQPGRTMTLRVFDHAGGLREEATILSYGRAFPYRRWTDEHLLVATSALSAAAGIAPDYVLRHGLDALGGRVELGWINESGVFEALDAAPYGVGETPVPAPDQALVRTASGGWSLESPVPLTFAGHWLSAPDCRAPVPAITFNEVLPSCRCDATQSFVELQSLTDRMAGIRGLTLVSNDAVGVEVARYPDIMVTRGGQSWGAGGHFLAATAPLSRYFNPDERSDFTLATPMPSTGELLLLLDHATGQPDTLQRFRYGPGTSNVRTHLGWSYTRTLSGSYSEAIPSPMRYGSSDVVFSANGGTSCAGTGAVARMVSAVWSCRDGTGGVSAIQLHVPGVSFPEDVGVRAFDRTGQLVFSLDRPFLGKDCATRAGAVDAVWLLGTASLESLLGSSIDGLMPEPLDPVAGAIELFRTGTAGTPAYFRYTYGGPGDPVVPFGLAGIPPTAYGNDGYDYVRLSRSDGAVLNAPSCLDHGPTSWSISEVGLSCADGGTSAQYVQIENAMAPQYVDTRIRLRILDHAGVEIGRMEPLAPELAGTLVATGRGPLIGAAGMHATTGLEPDVLLPVTLDPLGGLLMLEWVASPGSAPTILDAPGYAASTVVPGTAWRPHDPGRPGLFELQQPRSLAAGRVTDRSCFNDTCSAFLFGSDYGSALAYRDSLVGSFRPPGRGNESVLSYDWSKLSLSAELSSLGDRVYTTADDEFVLSGLPAGTPASLDLLIPVRTRASGTPIHCPYCTYSVTYASLEFAAGDASFNLLLGRDLDSTFTARINVVAGEPFRLHLSAGAVGGVVDGTGLVKASSRISVIPMNLPLGTQLTSCWGYRSSAPVATGVSLQSIAAFADRVELVWAMPFMTDVTLERRSTNDAPWSALVTMQPDGLGTLRWTDRAVLTGGHYEYRLSWSRDGQVHRSNVAAVDVPAAFRFALLGPRPNPATGDAAIWMELAREGTASLDLFDVAGRQLGSLRQRLEPGLHALHIPGSDRLSPGVYLIRLRQGDQEARRTFVVTR